LSPLRRLPPQRGKFKAHWPLAPRRSAGFSTATSELSNTHDLLIIIVVNEFAGAEESSGTSSTARLLAPSQRPSAADFVGLVPCPANAVSTSRSA
jgi:hypothetical protein